MVEAYAGVHAHQHKVLWNRRYLQNPHTGIQGEAKGVNDGEVDRYAAEGNNEPIIPEEMFNRVQEERRRRSNVEIGEDGVKRRKSTKYSAKKSD